MNGKFILGGSVFLWLKGNEALFYDSSSFERLCLKGPLTPSIVSFCESLIDSFNLRAVQLSGNAEVERLVRNLISKGLGIIVDKDSLMFSLPPDATMTNDIEDIKVESRKDFASKQDLTSFLRRITFYMGGESVKNNAYLQYPYPIDSPKALDLGDVMGMIHRTCPVFPNIKYDIIISDPLQEGLIDFLNKMLGLPIRFHLLLRESNEAIIKHLLEKEFEVEAIIDTTVSDPLTTIPRDGVEYAMMIRSKEDIGLFTYLQSQCPSISAFAIAEDNLEFFKENVFLTKEEISRLDMTRREIHIRQKVNPNFWGTLYVFPNGDVYPSSFLNQTEKLGSIQDNVVDMVTKEYYENHAWRKNRRDGACEECVLQWLCPSPTIYERIFGISQECELYNIEKAESEDS